MKYLLSHIIVNTLKIIPNVNRLYDESTITLSEDTYIIFSGGDLCSRPYHHSPLFIEHFTYRSINFVEHRNLIFELNLLIK